MTRKLHRYTFRSTTGNSTLHAAKIPPEYRGEVVIRSSTVHGACLQFIRLFHFHPFTICPQCDDSYFRIFDIDGDGTYLNAEFPSR